MSKSAPHQMLACKRKRTTGFAGGWKNSQIPAPTISMPFTSRETPMKNQMEIPPSRIFVSVPSLPQENVYYHKEDRVGTYHTARYAYDNVGNLQTVTYPNGG